MSTKSLLLLAVLLPLFACPGDDALPQDSDSESSTGTTGVDTGVTMTATNGMTGSTTESADTTVGDTTVGDMTMDDTTVGDVTMGNTTTGETTMGGGECGDGNVDIGEDCDDAGESATCNVDCTDAMCGDGLVNTTAMEDCDDSGESATCNVDCTDAMCGDGLVNATAMEDCDDANADDFDFCSNACVVAPAAVLDFDHVFDTDTGALDGVPQSNWDPTNFTWYLTGLEITGSLTVVGANPLTIQVDGDVSITGLLDVSGGDGGIPSGMDCIVAGVGGIGGPGGFDGGVGAGNGGSGTEDGEPGQGPGMAPAGGGVSSVVIGGLCGAAGGGGGGHLMPGTDGVGNNGGVGGLGGEMHMSLPPLVGGGGGGGGGVEKDGVLGMGLLDVTDDEGTGGGGGGGAVAIYSTTMITLTGTIDATGGDGGSDMNCPENPGMGGGGAGGTILLDSPATDTMLGVLDVSGGVGGQPTFNQASAVYVGGDGADGNVSVS